MPVFASVVTSSFDSPGQWGAHHSLALIFFFAFVQLSVSVIGLMPMSDGLSLMVLERTGGTLVGAGGGTAGE